MSGLTRKEFEEKVNHIIDYLIYEKHHFNKYDNHDIAIISEMMGMKESSSFENNMISDILNKRIHILTEKEMKFAKIFSKVVYTRDETEVNNLVKDIVIKMKDHTKMISEPFMEDVRTEFYSIAGYNSISRRELCNIVSTAVETLCPEKLKECKQSIKECRRKCKPVEDVIAEFENNYKNLKEEIDNSDENVKDSDTDTDSDAEDNGNEIQRVYPNEIENMRSKAYENINSNIDDLFISLNSYYTKLLEEKDRKISELKSENKELRDELQQLKDKTAMVSNAFRELIK